MAGFFGSGGYSTPGKGVEKDEREKRGLFKFFELLIRKFWRYVTLNLIYVLASVPVVLILFVATTLISGGILSSETVTGGIAALMGQETFDINNVDTAKLLVTMDIIIKSVLIILFTALIGTGPATAGFTYILRNFVREEHAWVWSDFWEMTFKNFKQATVVIVIDLIALVVGYFAYMFYGSMPSPMNYAKYVIFAAALVYVMMHFYIYPMMVTFKLKLKDIFKNALIFTFAKLPMNLLTLALVLFVHIGLAYLLIVVCGSLSLIYFIPLLFAGLVLEIIIGLSFSGLIVNFNIYPVIKKYMLTETDVEVKSYNKK